MRCILLILDGLGVGALPDADLYGDDKSNTLGNIAQQVNGLYMPEFEKLGLGNIIEFKGVSPSKKPTASFGKCKEQSVGKDTMTGHWEIMGAWTKNAFPTYPEGFGSDIVDAFETAIGKKVLGNKAASGTEIIKELGPEHIRTTNPIIYTSADSVFQIAAHKDVIKLEELYSMCRKAYEMFVEKGRVARIIARPFIGTEGDFKRTYERKDFTLKPPPNILDSLILSDIPVIGIGKISEIFSGRGISKKIHSSGNDELMKSTIAEFNSLDNGLVFTNLVDFDTLWGHRNNAKGYAKALEQLDKRIDKILSVLKEDDILIITADHGCDPTTASTDHSREYTPLLITGPKIKNGVDLGTRKSFSDIGQTIADFFGIQKTGEGQSFLNDILINA